MDLTAFQTTIQNHVKLATGFTDAKVIWANQTRDRPARPFVELAILDDEMVGQEEHGQSDTPGAPAGQEVTLSTRYQVELTVQVRVFSSEVVGSNTGSNVARKIRNYFGRDSVNVALAAPAIGVAVVDLGPVRDASIVLSTEHEGRGILDLKFRVADLDVETTTYIETATVETTVEQSNGNVTRTLTITQP
jgi:hypothetical protein